VYGLETAKAPVGATPVQSKRSKVRPSWVARFVSSVKVSSSVPPSVTGMPGGEGDGRIPGVRFEQHPQRPAGAYRQVLVDCDGDWWHWCGSTSDSACRIAVMITDDKQRAFVQLEAIDVTTWPNQVCRCGTRHV
jgi:hypothetical protein